MIQVIDHRVRVSHEAVGRPNSGRPTYHSDRHLGLSSVLSWLRVEISVRERDPRVPRFLLHRVVDLCGIIKWGRASHRSPSPILLSPARS
ncbi:unnamed protein product [Amoebophrya sp. A25]|nr:unnamed protein product [Amoebophrya sp. A25]|eukprot:GSA25T00023603001.1